MKPTVFQSAGLKDRRAITTQHYTAFKYVKQGRKKNTKITVLSTNRVKAESLLALNESLTNVKIGNTV